MEQLPEKIEQLLLPYFFEEDEKKKIAQTVYKIAVLLNGLSYTQIIIILKTLRRLTGYFCLFNSSLNTEDTP